MMKKKRRRSPVPPQKKNTQQLLKQLVQLDNMFYKNIKRIKTTVL